MKKSQILLIRWGKVANSVDWMQKMCKFYRSGTKKLSVFLIMCVKIANFIGRLQKNHLSCLFITRWKNANFVVSVQKPSNFISPAWKKLQISLITHGKSNFVDWLQKNRELSESTNAISFWKTLYLREKDKRPGLEIQIFQGEKFLSQHL